MIDMVYYCIPSEESPKPVKARSTATIDDFVPDGGEVESFLDDSEDTDEEDSEEDRCVQCRPGVMIVMYNV